MYASLPLICPSRVVCSAPVGLRDAEVEDARDAVDADEDVLRRDVAVDDAERLAALVRRLVRRVEAVERAAHDARPTIARRACAPPRSRVARTSRESDSPCDVLHDEEELAVASRRRRASATTFGCWMRAARRASSRNIDANSGSLASCGWSRLIATVRAKPTGPSSRPRWTVGHSAPGAISS